MSFLLKKMYGPSIVETVIIDNSDTIQIGDHVQLRNGNVEAATAGAASSGVVVGLVDKNGNSVTGSIADLGSATVSGNAGSEIVTCASDNETVDLIAAEIELSKLAIYSATVTGTMNTTLASNKIGSWLNADDKNSLDETTNSRTITDVRTFTNWGVDPADSSRMLVSLRHSEMLGDGPAQA